jgi:hypothetical protein
MTEADSCREFVTPELVEAGWGVPESVIGEQHNFTNGGIIVAGGKVRPGVQRCADCLRYYRRDFPLAVVEAKELGLPAETGVQQAREYAEMLGLKFAYAVAAAAELSQRADLSVSHLPKVNCITYEDLCMIGLAQRKVGVPGCTGFSRRWRQQLAKRRCMVPWSSNSQFSLPYERIRLPASSRHS